MKPVILCIDDEQPVLDTLYRDLAPRYEDRYEIELCTSAEEALELRDEILSAGNRVVIYIVDQRMPGMKGIDLLKQTEEDSGRILLTAYADTEVAIQGINFKCIDFYILKPYGEDLFKKIDHLLFASSKGTFVTIARTEEERRKALLAQNTVFSEEHLGLPYHKGIKIIGGNPYEEQAEIYVAVNNREVIGTTSVNRRNEKFAQRFGSRFGLPIEEFYDLTSLHDSDEDLVQIRNATVIPEYQTTKTAPMIWGQIYRDLTREDQPHKRVIILAASEIRDAQVAAALYHHVRRSDLYDQSFNIPLSQEDHPFFSHPPQKEELENVVLPRRLRMYVKMNFKFIGKPIYYSNFQMFDFPMLLKSDDLAEPYRTWFEMEKL